MATVDRTDCLGRVLVESKVISQQCLKFSNVSESTKASAGVTLDPEAVAYGSDHCCPPGAIDCRAKGILWPRTFSLGGGVRVFCNLLNDRPDRVAEGERNLAGSISKSFSD